MTYEEELLTTPLFHSADMPPKPTKHLLSVSYFDDVPRLLPILDTVHASEFLDYRLEARSADRWTLLNVWARDGVPLLKALAALEVLHRKALENGTTSV